MAKCKVVTHHKAQNCSIVESRQLVTVFEGISATGEVAEHLFIYQGKHLMKAWFSDQNLKKKSFFTFTFDSSFINTSIFSILVQKMHYIHRLIKNPRSGRFYFSMVI